MKAQIVFVMCLMSLGVSAQTDNPWQEYVKEVMTLDDTELSQESVNDLLSELSQHPLNLNTITREQLETLPFLTPQQIEELMAYRYRYGPLKSMGELQMIRSLDYARRRLLSCFVFVGDAPAENTPSLASIIRQGHHELIVTARIPFYTHDDEDSWVGYPYRHWLRYQFTSGDNVKAGLVGAQDAGEPFLSNRNQWGYDHYSFYLQLRHIGRFEALCLGHYRVSMGMGLVMNSDFSLGKMAILQNLGRSVTGIRAHSSRSDNYLQGLAATLDLGRGVKLTTFVSARKVDATLNKDSTVATILNTGYHRTEKELEKKHNLLTFKTGGCLNYRYQGFHVGMNTLYTHLDRELRPNTSALYRAHYPRGFDFFNTSVDYGYTSRRISLIGETAIDQSGHLATINTASWRLGDAISLMALQRFYAYSYSSLDAQSFSDGGRVQNESGCFVGLSWQPSPKFNLSAYTDFAYFGWARYQVSQSSYAWDHLLQGTFLHRQWTISGRYRLRRQQKDDTTKTTLITQTTHRTRFLAEYNHASGFSSQTQFDWCCITSGSAEWGMMLSQRISYTYQWLRIHAGIGYYHTDSYTSRVYLYEQSPLYTYAFSQFYGEGLRWSLMVRANIRQLTLTAKVGATDGRTDIDVQLRWKF
jgi:hypothetical protein